MKSERNQNATNQNGSIRRKQSEQVNQKTGNQKTVKQNDAVTDIVERKKRKRPDLTELTTPNTEPGEMSEMIMKAVTISHWPKIDTNDADQIAERIDEYHAFCIQNDMKPSMVGLALAIGVDRATLWKWENGVESNKPQSIRTLIKKGREINELIMVMMMQNGKINPVTGIFLLKNNHGYKDQTDVVVTPNNPLQGLDTDRARQNILQALPDDTDE